MEERSPSGKQDSEGEEETMQVNRCGGRDAHEEQDVHNSGTGPVFEEKEALTEPKALDDLQAPQTPTRQHSKTRRVKSPATIAADHEKQLREAMKSVRSGKPMPAPDSADKGGDMTDRDRHGAGDLTKKAEKLDMIDVAGICADVKAVEAQVRPGSTMLMPKDDSVLLAKVLLGVGLPVAYSTGRVATVCLQYGLIPGSSEDLCNVWDIDKAEGGRIVEDFVDIEQPWLLADSPPCTMCCSLRNINVAKHQHDPMGSNNELAVGNGQATHLFRLRALPKAGPG